ncbi:MAG TPA: hypothetical protein VGG29_16250 [Caulobacteraceae bacterium]|jgi:hypothetical protein
MRTRVGDIWRGGGLVLVALALALRLAVPAGWMVAQDASGAAQLVICTGHAMGREAPPQPGQPPKSHDDHPCAFAGHVTPTPPTLAAGAAPLATLAYADAPAPIPVDQQPGRGLAAPPPPAVGPPAASI